jgi:hypothetical protein
LRRCRGKPGDHGHVEAYGQSREVLALLQELLSGSNDPPAFESVNARGGAAIRVARARSYLHDQQRASMERDQVELPEAATVVPQKELGALRCEVVGRDALGLRPERATIDRRLAPRQAQR